MRPFSYILCALVISLSASLYAASDLTISDTFVDNFSENAFKRISQYFGFPAKEVDRIVFRQKEGKYGGVYMVVRLGQWASSMPEGTKLKVQYVTAKRNEPVELVFTFPNTPSLTHEVYVGISGTKISPKVAKDVLAWRVSLLDELDQELDTLQSFLWSSRNG